LAHFLGVPQNRITAIINGKRGISADTAIRLSKCFGMSAEMWINLQADYELRRARFDGLTEIAEREVRVFAEVS
jgi:addiction module HigA family antidote